MHAHYMQLHAKTNVLYYTLTMLLGVFYGCYIWDVVYIAVTAFSSSSESSSAIACANNSASSAVEVCVCVGGLGW